MDVVIVNNGLGNQMSQYAFYTAKKDKSSHACFLPISCAHNGYELDNIFSINPPSCLKVLFLYWLFRFLLLINCNHNLSFMVNFVALFGLRLVRERSDYKFESRLLLPSSGIRFFYGGWHSELYYSDVLDPVRRTFRFPALNDSLNNEYAHIMRDTNSVSIHVRRGDYQSPNNISTFGSVCTLSYFLKAIRYITSKLIDPRFFVFSNDLSWCRENLPLRDAHYISHNRGSDSWRDMQLMTFCKHNIISNSTFSWWGAWLNENPGKLVICPAKFVQAYDDSYVYPLQWIKIIP